MFFPLLLAFTIVPAIEIALFINIGGRIGVPSTVAVILLTGIAGASLARAQGVRVMLDIQEALGSGKLPAGELVEGGLVLVGGALLLTPGFLTDLSGLCCLLPPTRKAFSLLLLRWFRRRLDHQGPGWFQAKGFTVQAGPVRPGRAARGAEELREAPTFQGPETIDASFTVVEEED